MLYNDKTKNVTMMPEEQYEEMASEQGKKEKENYIA